MSWQELAAKKRQQLADDIPEKWIIPEDQKPGLGVMNFTHWSRTSKWFTDEEQVITSTPASQLVQNLAVGELSAETAVRAFSKKAAAAQQLVYGLIKIQASADRRLDKLPHSDTL